MKGLLYIFNWGRIRSLGELRILTHVSYIMLIVVPFLAALWPSVRSVVNRYNQVVKDSVVLLENTSAKLEEEAKALEAQIIKIQDTNEIPLITDLYNKAHDTITSFDNKVKVLIQEGSTKTIEKKDMPSIWAYAFFAALSVLVAQTVYQICAPEAIRTTNKKQFVQEAMGRYARNPTEGALSSAQYFIGKADVAVPCREEAFKGVIPGSIPNKLREETDIIAVGARVEYDLLAKNNPAGILISTTFYTIALLLIVYIIISQSWAVAQAAGWITSTA